MNRKEERQKRKKALRCCEELSYPLNRGLVKFALKIIPKYRAILQASPLLSTRRKELV